MYVFYEIMYMLLIYVLFIYVWELLLYLISYSRLFKKYLAIYIISTYITISEIRWHCIMRIYWDNFIS